eukprot:m.716529 g.716529  ORF g.716529 m.716529 type:complete len:79 (-) comp22984_c1_seq31:89-325(-)
MFAPSVAVYMHFVPSADMHHCNAPLRRLDGATRMTCVHSRAGARPTSQTVVAAPTSNLRSAGRVVGHFYPTHHTHYYS